MALTDDERRLVEWVLWNVRVCDLPDDVGEAASRVDATGAYPRPPASAGYDRVAARVTAFPIDEQLPLRTRYATRPHLGSVVTSLFVDDVAYLLVQEIDHLNDASF